MAAGDMGIQARCIVDGCDSRAEDAIDALCTRHAAEQRGREMERARIVALVRERAEAMRTDGGGTFAALLDDIADELERPER